MNKEQLEKLIEAATPLITTYAVRVVGVLVVLWIAFKVARRLGDSVTARLEAREFDTALSRFFGSLLRWAIILGAVLGCLGMFGIETTSFAAVIGAAGLAVGLAFQGTLSNFAAGVMILVFRPFRIGDVVSAAGVTGKIIEIGLFTTTLDTPDNRRIIVPNSEIAGKTNENVTANKTRRVDLSIGAAYAADIDETRAALEKAIEKVDSRLKKGEHQVFLVGLGDSSVNWQVRIWCKTENYFAVHEQGLTAMKKALEEADIAIPFPNMEVHFMNAMPKGE
ncbi:MAG: mechanosensitive ion channel [Polyangiaceae bacterium]